MFARSVLAVALALALAGCGGDTAEVKPADDPNAPAAPDARGVPSDEVVLKEMQDRIRDEISVELSDGDGEVVWSRRDGTWYYQRGYIVKRPANLDGFDDAVLEVGGLSLWVWGGSGWSHQKDLVTWNTYEGIPEPDGDALIELVQASRLNYMPVQMGGKPQNFRMADPPNLEWHNANSVSFNFLVDAPRIDWQGNKLDQTTMTLRTRVYRDGPDAPWKNPLVPEAVDVKVHSSEPKTPQELGELTNASSG